ncbi:S41 family peptidase [Empedobacter tilapiae]|uniref:S41 family peptidase n=1 Tax=Empedobacter tilapiae TaxID=2491114 RepID=UPI0028D68BFF|nr:S41 family peptidase [Empedobacter tilapiae]
MNKFFTLLSITFLSSCVSVQKYNAHIDEKIDTDKLRKDVDFTKEKLLRKHVDIDLYYSKETIANRLDSFKNTIQQPMKPNDFSRELSKVVSSFGHGHTVVTSFSRKITKETKKKYKDSKGPMNLLEFKSLDNHLYLNKNNSKDSTLVLQAEILSINGIKFQDYYNLYNNYRKGDGYITTLSKYMYGNSYLRFVSNEIGVQDSIFISFQKNDSVFTKIVKREYKEKKDKSFKKNSLDTIQKKSNEEQKFAKLSKEQKLKRKQLLDHKKKVKKYFAYSSFSKEYQREISFPDKNDSTTVVLKIKTFSLGNSKKAYPFIFDSINKLNVKNLILDVRNNGGGYVRDANYLYSFLTTRNQRQAVMTDKMRVNSKFGLMKNYFQSFGVIGNTLGLPLAVYKYSESIIKTKKEKDGYYYKVTGKKDFLLQPERYKGNLYVLTNGMSYSATSILSAALQNEGKAIFVGEETGGDYNGTVAGSFNDFKLKNSKLKIYYGMIDFKPNTSRDLKGRGIIPDVPIEITFDDVVKRKDTQLDWILSDIKNKH